MIGAGAAAAIFLVPGAPGGEGQQPEATAKSEQLLDLENLQPRSVKVRALMETAFEWNDDLEYGNSDLFKQKSAEIKERFKIDFSNLFDNRLNSEKFQKFDFKNKLSFLRKPHKNDN